MGKNDSRRAILDLVPIPVVTLDKNARVTLWNRAATRVFGWRPGEILGKPYPLVPGEKRPEFRNLFRRILGGQEFLGIELRRKRKDGATADVTVWASPLYNEKGRIDGVFAAVNDITTRKRAEEQALLQGMLLKAQQETALDGILLVDEHGKILSYNQKFVDLWGIPDRVLRTRSSEATIQFVLRKISDPKGFLRGIRRLYRHRRMESRDEVRRKDGRIIDRFSSPILGQDDRYYGRVWYFRDITETKRAERELIRQETFLRSIVENIPDMIFLKDAKDLRFALFNRAGEELLGRSRNQLIGKSDRDFFPRTMADFFIKKDRETLRQKKLLDIPEEPIITPHKGLRTLHTKKIPILDSSGNPTHLLGISEDITERKRVEIELRDSERRFRQLAEGIREVFWLSAADHREIIYISPAYEEIWGRTCESLYRSPVSWLEAVHPSDIARVRKAFRAQKTSTYDIEYRIVRPDGSVRWINDRAFPVRDESGKIIRMAGIAEDITEKKRALEIETLERREQMQREFLANVSHEFRTPVSAIKGFTETLLLGGWKDEKHRLNFTKAIERHANRLSKLVENVLELSSMESDGQKPPRPENILLHTFVQKTLAGMALLARRNGLRVRTSIEHPLRVLADKDDLASIFQHLLDNAIKYNRRRGEIVITGRSTGKKALISIRNTGPGIPAKEIPNIFQRFYRARRRGSFPGGTGLGLAIAKQHVEANGGLIWVRSIPGKETTFSFLLPMPH